MAKFQDVLPQDARARIEAAADAEKRARGLWGETKSGGLRPVATPLEGAPVAVEVGTAECGGAPIQAFRLTYGVRVADDSQREATAAALEVLQSAIEQGEVVARGWRPDAPLDAPPTAAHPERWQTVVFDPATDVARDRATGAVVAVGVAFERAEARADDKPHAIPSTMSHAIPSTMSHAIPSRPGGRPRKARLEEIEAAVKKAGLRPEKMALQAFLEKLLELGVDPKADALVTYCSRFDSLLNHRERIEKLRRQVFDG